MDEEQNTEVGASESNADTEAREDAAPAEKTFTQAEVDALIKERLKRVRRRPRPKPELEKLAEPAENAVADDGSWRDDFYDAIMGHDLSKGQLRRMRKAFKTERPEDPDAWVAEYCEDFGIGSGERKQATEPETTDTSEGDDDVKPKGPPVSNKGAPAAIPDYDTEIDPNRLTADDVRRMYQKYGEREAEEKIFQMVKRHYSGRDVVVPP